MSGPEIVAEMRNKWKHRRQVKKSWEVWVSDLVFGFRLDPCHDLLEFIGQLGTSSHWPRDR